jgi:hypothetical protein
VLDCLLVGGDRLQLAKKLGSQVNVPVIVTSGDIEKAEQAGRWTWTEFALDSALEEGRFELPVPPRTE